MTCFTLKVDIKVLVLLMFYVLQKNELQSYTENLEDVLLWTILRSRVPL